MRTRTIAALLLTLVAASAVAAGNVDVYIAGAARPQKITAVAHLADLVTQPQLAQSWWPGAVIDERQAAAAAEQQRQALLMRLAAVAADEDGDAAAATNALRRQLQALRVSGRQFVALDPDRVRVAEGANPPLAGDYRLWVGPQPVTVSLFGLIDKPGKTAFIPGKSVADYLDDVSRLSGGDRSYAWVVYPDGRTQKAPVAYWNQRHVEPMPGSIIFVGFAGSLWTKRYDELNAEILRSLTQRIPEQ